MTNINRRAALIGAAASSLSLSLPAISSVRAKEPETVADFARRLQAALEQDGRPWRVVVTAEAHRIDFKPVTPWEELVEQLDARAAGYDGWRLHAGRSVITRSVGTVRLFINGVLEATTASFTENFLAAASRPIVGAEGYTLGANAWSGYFDELRVRKGTAEWTADFTSYTQPYT